MKSFIKFIVFIILIFIIGRHLLFILFDIGTCYMITSSDNFQDNPKNIYGILIIFLYIFKLILESICIYYSVSIFKGSQRSIKIFSIAEIVFFIFILSLNYYILYLNPSSAEAMESITNMPGTEVLMRMFIYEIFFTIMPVGLVNIPRIKRILVKQENDMVTL